VADDPIYYGDPKLRAEAETERARFRQAKLKINGNGGGAAIVDHGRDYPLNLEDFLAKQRPKRELVLAPWLPEKGLVMIHAAAGIGKTLLALSCAYAIATGRELLGWKAPAPKRVVYFDGEMPGDTLAERMTAIQAGLKGKLKAPDYLRILSADDTDAGIPDLCTTEGQAWIDARIGPSTVIFLDSVSTLMPSVRQNESDDWAPVQGWMLAQRRAGRCVVMIHHDNKQGTQNGTARRVVPLDTVTSLRRPEGYSSDQAARFIVEYDKARHFWGDDARPFEAQFEVRADGAASWSRVISAQPDPAADTVADLTRVVRLARSGKTVRTIATELKWSRSKVGRLRTKAADLGLLDAEDPST
jgi:hypothetical protein